MCRVFTRCWLYVVTQLQVGETEHIMLSPEWLQYVNHSCTPNVFFDTSTLKLIALKDIKAGEELCFFYPRSVHMDDALLSLSTCSPPTPPLPPPNSGHYQKPLCSALTEVHSTFVVASCCFHAALSGAWLLRFSASVAAKPALALSLVLPK